MSSSFEFSSKVFLMLALAIAVVVLYVSCDVSDVYALMSLITDQ